MIEKDHSFCSVKHSKAVCTPEDYFFETNDHIAGFDGLNMFSE
jgi:hypothetical protein